MNKKYCRVVSLLMIVGLLFISFNSFAQKKTNQGKDMVNILSGQLDKLEKEYPRKPASLIEVANKLETEARKARRFAPMIRGIKVSTINEEYLDPLKIEGKFTRLYEAAQLPWVTEKEKVLAKILLLSYYAEAYRVSRYSRGRMPLVTIGEPVNEIVPKQWTSQQYLQRICDLYDDIVKNKKLLLSTIEKEERNLFFEKLSHKLLGILFLETLEYREYALENLQGEAGSYMLRNRWEETFKYMMEALKTSEDCIDLQLLRVKFNKRSSWKSDDEIIDELTIAYNRFQKKEVVLPLAEELIRTLVKKSQKAKALEIIEEVLTQFSYKGKNQLSAFYNAKETILHSYFIINYNGEIRPNEDLQVNLEYCNIQKAEIELYRLKKTSFLDLIILYRGDTDYKKYLSGEKPDVTFSLPIVNKADYESVSDSIAIKSPVEKGTYIIRLGYTDIQNKKQERFDVLQVSDAMALTLTEINGCKIHWLNSTTGQPLTQKTIDIGTLKRSGWEQKIPKFDFSEKLKTDRYGLIPANREGELHLYLDAKTDNLYVSDYFNFFDPGTLNSEKRETKTRVFTDRNIYRPGQKVFFSGIVYNIGYNPEAGKVLTGEKVRVKATDANGEVFYKEDFSSDKYGVFEGSFEVPADRLLGRYRITVEVRNLYYSGCYIHVEEYKRPSFEVLLVPLKEPYKIGGKTQVNGSAKKLSGFPIQGATVNYTVTARKINWGWRYYFYNDSPEIVLASGTLKTSSEGLFEIPVQFTNIDHRVSLEDQKDQYTYYKYKVEAVVTDLSGETHEETTEMFIGAIPVKMEIDMNEYISKESPRKPWAVLLKNNQDRPVDGKISYTIKRWGADEVVLKGRADANKNIVTSKELSSLPSGKYRVEAAYRLPEGEKVEAAKEFFVFSPNDSEIPSPEPLWATAEKEKYKDNQKAVLLWGTSLPGKQVFYRIFYVNGTYKDGSLTPEAGKMNRLELPAPTRQFEEQYRKVLIYLVDNKKVYEKSVKFSREFPVKEMDLQWQSFRNKLLTGKEETWQLKILMPNGKPATHANLASWMTDASLDMIIERNTDNILQTHLEEPEYYCRLRNITSDKRYIYAQENEIYLEPFEGGTFLKEEIAVAMKTSSVGIRGRGIVGIEEDAADLKEDVLSVRKNFDELAYFKPRMHTDNKGEVSWSFTLPESLTRWRVELFAHTPELFSATKQDFVEAYKEFMIEPNIPRFIRFGDRGVIGGSVRNMSKQTVKGSIKLELFDLNTDSILHKQTQDFSVEAGSSLPFALTLEAIAGYEAIGVRVMAQSKKFSDGEQHVLTQLPASVMVTETVPFRLDEEKTEVVDLQKLFPAGQPKQGRLTVEAVGNPLFLAMQQLPIMAADQSMSAISLASALYSINIATYLTDQPGVKQWFADRRKALGKVADTSALKRNDALKQQTSQQTPWLHVADSEEARMRAFLDFMQRPQASRIKVLENKLAELQSSDGNWRWFPGMEPNAYLTSYIMTLLVRQKQFIQLFKPGREFQIMYEKGWRALDRMAVNKKTELEKELKKNPKIKPYLPYGTLNWLYLIAMDSSRPASTQDRYESTKGYFLKILTDNIAKLSLYEMPEAAIIFYRMGRKDLADKLTESLIQHLTTDQEQGAFFAMLHTGEYWWTDRTFSTHTGTIELLNMMRKHPKVVAQMQRWLLAQKRTTQWASTIATADAVYALLSGEDRVEKLQPDKLEIRMPLVNGTLTAKGEVVNHTVPLNKVPEKSKLTLSHSRKSPVWGGVFASYEMPLDKVQSSGKDITVRKELYIPVVKDGREKLERLSEGMMLKPGQKIVTVIFLGLNRSMDFVSLHDMRPACLEPVTQISGYQWGAGTGYYCEIRDNETRFFFNHLTRGEYRLQYEQVVVRTGIYQNGIATAQSAYAPEYSGHTKASQALKVQE